MLFQSECVHNENCSIEELMKMLCRHHHRPHWENRESDYLLAKKLNETKKRKREFQKGNKGILFMHFSLKKNGMFSLYTGVYFLFF